MALRLVVSAHSDPHGRTFAYDFDGDRTQILLGRRGGVDVLLPHPAVSLVHARIERRGDVYQIIDDGSANGTRVNDATLEAGQGRALSEGDRVAIGEFVVEVAALDASDAPAGESSISIARRMVAEVLGVLDAGAAHPVLAGLDGAPRLALDTAGRSFSVGRDGGCDMVLADSSVAMEHVRVRRDEVGVTACDLGSHCGLYVNDQFVTGERVLRDGDLLQLGRVQLRFSDPADRYLKKLEQVPSVSPGAPAALPARRVEERLLGETGPPPSRGDALVVGVAATIAAAALAGLIYLWLS